MPEALTGNLCVVAGSGLDQRLDAAKVLRAAYGFRQVDVGEALEGGYANDVLRVVCDGREFVLRIKLPPAIAEDIAWEHALLERLAEGLPYVQAPVRARDGRTVVELAGRAAWLAPFIDGAPADPRQHRHRLAAARALAHVHAAGAALSVPPRPSLRPLVELDWPELALPPELEDFGEEIEEGRAWAIAYVAGVAADRRPSSSLIHGDFFPGNVLVDRDDVAAVVDWEEAQLDWLTWDLANALNTFCAAGDDLERSACADFVAAYRDAGGTAPAHDDDLLVPFVRVKRVLEVLRAPTDRVPRWDHQRRNLRSLARLGS